jgi:hypothetical protein
MSAITFLTLATSYKVKILARLVKVFTEELASMIADAAFAALSPSEKMFAHSELTHWYQRWFHLIPPPATSSVEMDDFTEVINWEIPSAVFCIREGVTSYYDDFIPVTVHTLSESFDGNNAV